MSLSIVPSPFIDLIASFILVMSASLTDGLHAIYICTSLKLITGLILMFMFLAIQGATSELPAHRSIRPASSLRIVCSSLLASSIGKPFSFRKAAFPSPW